jgi:hypothetical protein
VPGEYQILFDRIQAIQLVIGEAAHAICPVAAVRLGHVERHVEQVHHAFPRQVLLADRQREGRIADRDMDAQGHA